MSTESLFMSPERIVFGQGTARQAGRYVKELNGKKAFIITDKIVSKLDVFTEVVKSLQENGVDYIVYSDVDANPSDIQVEKGAALYQKENADVLIAIGGGSSLDSAKAIGILVSNGGSICDYDYDADADWTNPDVDPIINPIPPLVTIPTTSGTGAEVTAFAVITNTRDNYKMFPGSWRTLPRIALVDPLMTASMPPLVTAATGMDALSHAVEAYCSPYAMSQTDLYALSAMTLIAENIVLAVGDGTLLDAREAMSLASMQAGLCMNAWCGGVHALGHQLSSQYGMPHGMAMAIMMPVVMSFNSSSCTERMVDIARTLGANINGLSLVEAAKKAPEAVRDLAGSIGLPVTLSAAGVNPDKFAECAKWAVKDIDMAGNPCKITQAQAEVLYQKAYTGEI